MTHDSEPLHLEDRFRPQQLLPVRTARLATVVGPDQDIVAKQRLIEKHIFQCPAPAVLPYFVRPRAPCLRPVQLLGRRSVLHEDPAPVGPPSGDLRRPTLPKAAVRLRDAPVEV